jgi:hypothetical protein
MKATQRVSALQGEQPDDLIARGAGCEGISLRGTPMRPKIEPNRLGIRGMSVNACRTRRVHQWVVALIRKGRV